MKRVLWLVKVVGMGVVVVMCLAFIHRMAMVKQLVPSLWPLLPAIIVVSTGYVYWAYRVIWRPIDTSGERR